jgi:hypothetical protein
MPIDLRDRASKDPFDVSGSNTGGAPIDLRAPARPVDDKTFQESLFPKSADVLRGLRTGLLGQSAASSASEALAAEKAGDQERFRSKLRRAQIAMEDANALGPRVSKLEDIGGVGDAIDWAQGAFAQGAPTMLPSVAGGLAGGVAGGLLAGPPGALAGGYAGATAPAIAMERADQILAQYQDPAQAAQPVDLRDKVATTKGVVAGALEGLVPAGLARVPGVRQLTKGVTRAALSEAATEGAQEFTGITAEDYLNPNRDKLDDTSRMLNAAASGAIVGGGMQVATRPIGAAKGLIDAARETGGNTAEFVRRAFPGQVRDDADHSAVDLKLGDANPLLYDDDPYEFGRKLTAAGVSRAKRAADMAAAMIRDPETTAEVKRALAKFKGAFDSPEAQEAVANAHFASRAGKVAADVVSKFEKAWAKGKALAKGVAAGAQEGVKRSAETPEATFQNVLQVLNANLKEGYQGNQQVIAYVRQIARALAGGAEQELSDERIKAVANLTRMFDNPVATFQQVANAIGSPNLSSSLGRVARASFDASDVNSVLRRSVVPEAAEHLDNDPEAAEELGRLIDRLITQGLGKDKAQTAAAIGALSQVFGGEEQLNDVLNYYMEAHGKELGKDKTVPVAERVLLSDDDADVDPDAPEAQMTTHETPEARYHFRRVGEENEPFESKEEARKLRQEGKRTGKVVSVGHMLRQTGHSAGPTAARLRAKAASRLSNRRQQGSVEEVAKRKAAVEAAKTPEERTKAQARYDYARQLVTPNALAETRRLAERVELLNRLSDDDVLEQFFVMEDTGIPANEFDVTDSEFAQMRTLQDKGQTRDKEADAKRKATLFSIEVGDQGKTVNVSAESIWKTWAKKMQKLGETYRGESKRAFIARMFMEGLGGLRLRDDVTSIPGLRDDLLIDRATGLTWGDVKARSTGIPGVKMPRQPLENPPVNVEGIGDVSDDYAPGVEYDAETGTWYDYEAIEQRQYQLSPDEARTAKMLKSMSDAQKVDEILRRVAGPSSVTTRKPGPKFRPIKRKRDSGVAEIEEMDADALEATEKAMLEAGEPLIPSVVREEMRADRARDERRNPGGAPKDQSGLSAETNELFKSIFGRYLKGSNKKISLDELSDTLRKNLIDRIDKTVGKLANVLGSPGAEKDVSGANEIIGGEATIWLGTLDAILASGMNADEVADHEIAHVAVSALSVRHGKDVAKQVVQLANKPHIKKQVLQILKDQGIATEYFTLNPEEMFAQAYSFWRSGKLKLEAKDSVLERVFSIIKDLLAQMTGDQVLNQVFQAIDKGQMAKLSLMYPSDIAKSMVERASDPDFALYTVEEMSPEQIQKAIGEEYPALAKAMSSYAPVSGEHVLMAATQYNYNVKAGMSEQDALASTLDVLHMEQLKPRKGLQLPSGDVLPDKLPDAWAKRVDEVVLNDDYSVLNTPEKSFAFVRAAARRAIDLMKDPEPSSDDDKAYTEWEMRREVLYRLQDAVFGNTADEDMFMTETPGWDKLSEAEQEKFIAAVKELKEQVSAAWLDARKKGFRNAEFAWGPQTTLTQEEKDKAIAEIVKRRGKDIKVEFVRMIGGSGLYNPTERLISIGLGVGSNLMNVVRHESIHDLFATLNKADELQRKTWEEIKSALSKPYVMNQLKRLLKDHPTAIEDAMKDPEEAAAYAYQFWAEGKLTLGPATNNFFTRIAQFFRNMMGILSQEDKVEQLLVAFDQGKFNTPSTAGAVLRDLQLETLKDKINRVAKPLADVGDKILTSGTDQLRGIGFKSLTDIADLFYREAEREQGGDLPFIQAVNKQRAIYMNRVARLTGNASRETIAKAWQSLIRNEPADTPEAQAIASGVRTLLDDMHAYMKSKGVKRLDKDQSGKITEVELGFIKDYYPRAWDPAKLRTGRREFLALLLQHGNMTVSEANEVFHALTDKDGQINLAENDHHVGYTPYLKNIQRRTLDFINQTNVRDFEKFMDTDMVNTLSTYIIQAAHRAEYAQRFGNQGQVIRNAMKAARDEGATSAEIDRAAKIVRGLEGTLNHNFSREARQLFNALTTYQNIVLLPFALMNSIVDPMGIAVRSGDWKEAWAGLSEGFRGLGMAMVGKEKSDERRKLAEDLGIIDNTLQLAVLGDVYSGPYMSKWLKQVNERFFRWNGMSIWNDRMRIAAVAAGERFIIRHANSDSELSQRYMKELGLEGYKPTGDHVDTSDPKVKDALYKFVDGAVLRPNAAHRPTWGSDPMWQLIFHLKQFAFSFQNTILRRGIHELEHGNTLPTTMIATYIPIAMAMGAMKASLLGKPLGGPIDMLMKGMAQSGVMGTGVFGHEAFMDAAAGGVPGQSFAGPTIGHGIDVAQTVAGAPGQDIGRLLERSAPLSPLVKAVS